MGENKNSNRENEAEDLKNPEEKTKQKKQESLQNKAKTQKKDKPKKQESMQTNPNDILENSQVSDLSEIEQILHGDEAHVEEKKHSEEILLDTTEKESSEGESPIDVNNMESIDMQKYLQDESEIIEDVSSDKEEIEDISSNSKKSLGTRIAYFWKRKDNTGKKVLIVILGILLIAILAVAIYLISRFSLLGTNHDEEPTTHSEDVTYEDINFSMMNDITDAKSLNELIREWATNKGEKMSSQNVINILLIGVDSQSNLSDSMILVSLNKSTKQINMVSFYRDSYIYIQPQNKNPRFAKLNAAFSAGGAPCVVKTIEDSYKVKIDDYVYVDYKTFPKAIDALGGVKINVQPYEAKYLNNHYGLGIGSGNVTLNGEQALKYCQIRKSDSDGDVSRTRRQRDLITSVMNTMKNASLSKLDNMITTVFPNIKTSMSKTQVLSFGTQALTKGWLNFEMGQANMPTKDTGKTQMLNGQSVWICDYPGAAYQLQMLLYGKSNIKLAPDRISALDLKPTTTTTRPYSQNINPETSRTTSTIAPPTQPPPQTNPDQPKPEPPKEPEQPGGQKPGTGTETTNPFGDIGKIFP